MRQRESERGREGSERVHLVRAIKNGHLNWSGSLPGSVLIFRRMCAMSKATFDKWSKGVAAQQPSPSPAEAEQEHVYLSFFLFLLSPSLWCVCICYLNIYAIFIKKNCKKITCTTAGQLFLPAVETSFSSNIFFLLLNCVSYLFIMLFYLHSCLKLFMKRRDLSVVWVQLSSLYDRLHEHA